MTQSDQIALSGSAAPRPEHPRPDAARPHWRSLNGEWDFAFDSKNLGEQERWYRQSAGDEPFRLKINVPFPWESELSGVCHPDYRGAGWYRRRVEIPLQWLADGLRPILRFEAVDWNAKVWVNGRYAGEHDGGYSPFEVDLTPFLDESPTSQASSTGIPQTAVEEELRDWLARLQQAPALTPRQEMEMARRSAAGDADARARLREASLRYIHSVAIKMVGRGVPLADLIAAGDEGLAAAVESFNPEYGHPFSAYATRRIRRAIAAAVTGHVASASADGASVSGDPALHNILRPVVVVRAWDVCAADTPLGKQVKEWYTPSSGIWQTVWLEGRPASHVRHAHFSPDVPGRQCHARVWVETEEPGAHEVVIRSKSGAFEPVSLSQTLPAGESQVELTLPVPNSRLWSCADPYLYEVEVELGAGDAVHDTLSTYFGMREISRGTWRGSEHEYVLLNGEPIYLRGVLDQAFYPDGLHTYPSDEAIQDDIRIARDAGFNLIRCHIKVNEPRYYYWADRMGMLVMSDIPSPKIYTARSRANWEQTFRDAVYRDFNHPSIIAWILFNETWGLEEHETDAGWTWINQMYRLCRALDPTRLAEDNSACLYDHVATDLNSWHFYINSYDRARRHVNQVVARTLPGSPFNFVGGDYLQGTEPLLNSEYGGIGASDGDRDISHCMKFLTAELRRHPKIVGYVYTELSDIEWEHNGIVNYDRSEKEFGYDAILPGMTVESVHSVDFIGVDAPPCQTVKPGAALEFPIFFSQFSRDELSEMSVRWSAALINTLGESSVYRSGNHAFAPERYGVCPAGSVELAAPGEPGLLTLSLEAMRPNGEIAARHYVQVEVHDPALPAEQQRGGEWLLRWNPGDFSTSEWADAVVSRKGWKFAARSSGAVEYEVVAPEKLDLANVKGVRLLFEAGARTASRRLEWKAKRGHLNYPQTEVDRKYGSDILVTINGVSLGGIHLPDDPADARGILSHHNEIDPGSYGFLTDLRVTEDQVSVILQRAAGGVFTVRFTAPKQAVHRGGLSLYGRRLGAFPIDPTLILSLE